MRQRILSLSVRRILFGIVLGLSAATEAAATGFDLTSGTTGTVFPNQSFSGETRAAHVVTGGMAFTVESMTLNHLTINVSGTVGARIYDGSGTLIASANAVVGSGADQSVTIPVFASLAANQSYWIAFHVSTGGVVNVIDPTPAGLAVTPYAPTAGYFTVTASGSAPGDALPTPANSFIPLNMTVTGTPGPDGDGDGRPDSVDNCTLVPNGPLQLDVGGHSQLDTDGDDYGNLCDADLNNSDLVTAADFNLLRSVLNQTANSSALAAAADMNGSGTVTAADFLLLRARLNTAPGPSGLNCTPGTVGCGWEQGDITTFTQIAWGDSASDAGALLTANFSNMYGGVLVIGGTFFAVFTNSGAVFSYLPALGPASSFTASTQNPVTTASGELGGEVLALQLNVDFSKALLLGTTVDLGSLRFCNVADVPVINGQTVDQFLGTVNNQLGGGVAPFGPSTAASIARKVNGAFVDGTPSTFAQDNLVNGTCP